MISRGVPRRMRRPPPMIVYPDPVGLRREAASATTSGASRANLPAGVLIISW
jgi:hypothetical protein